MQKYDGLIEVFKLTDINEVNNLLQHKDSNNIISFKILDVYHSGETEIISVFIVGRFEDLWNKEMLRYSQEQTEDSDKV